MSYGQAEHIVEKFGEPAAAIISMEDFRHVNNVVYVRWVQEVSTAHWVAAATDAWKEAIGWVVVRHEIDYLDSARLGDEIVGRTWVGAARKHIFERTVEIVRVRDQVVLARARSLWCPIDLRSRRLARVGAEIYERFSVSRNESDGLRPSSYAA